MHIIAIKDENPKNLVGYKFWNGIQVGDDNNTYPEFAIQADKSVLKAVVYTSEKSAEANVDIVKGYWKRHRRCECEIEVISAEQAVTLINNLK